MKKIFCLISLLVVGYCCFAMTHFKYNEKQKEYYIYDDVTDTTTVIVKGMMRGKELKEGLKEVKSALKELEEIRKKCYLELDEELKEELEELLEDYKVHYKYLMECKKCQDEENKNWK